MSFEEGKGCCSECAEEKRLMNTIYKIALAMLAGVGFGAVATQGLRAQAKAPTYVVIAIQKITDPEAYKPLPVKGQAAAEAAGGRYLIRTGNITSLDGNVPTRFALIRFDSVEKAQAFNNSEYFKKVSAIRNKTTEARAFIVEGMPQ